MPAKKIKLDQKQRSLTVFLPSFSVSQEKEKETASVECESETKQTKVRTFQSAWKTHYSWLCYEETENFMFCKLYTDGNKMNAMHRDCKCQNFRKTTLSRHAELPDHQLLVQAPLQRQNLQRLNEKNESQQDKALKALLRTFHWICVENIPICKFKSMVELMHEMEVPDIAILKQIPFGYDSEYTASELLDSLAAVAEAYLNDQLNRSSFVTVLTDESTDLSNSKRLVLYAQLISEDMRPSTVYINIIECKDTSGKGIAAAVLQELSQRGVPTEKVMSLGSDGASVMTGKKNGVAAIMRRSNPHMVNVHCVAHRLALCTSQAAADIPLLQKHQQTLTDLFYYFKGSSKRESRLHEVQAILDDPCLTIKEVHSVRWLSYFNALTTVFRSLDSIFTYLEELHSTGKDPKATGLKKKMATDTFVGTTYMLMDAMAPVTILPQFFQTENIDIALVKALALVEEETRRYRPTKNYLEYLPSASYNSFETEIMKTEFERLQARLPMDMLSMKRYELPQPAAGKMTDVASWNECVENSQAQLEHQSLRILNLELMQEYGASAWKVYNDMLVKMMEQAQHQLQDIKKKIQEINWQRKNEQSQAGAKLKDLESSWVGLVSKNYEIERACVELEKELSELEGKNRQKKGKR